MKNRGKEGDKTMNCFGYIQLRILCISGFLSGWFRFFTIQQPNKDILTLSQSFDPIVKQENE